MITKRFPLLLVTILLVIFISACERPASVAPKSVGSPTVPEGGFPLPGVTEDVMGQLQSFATQTAFALAGGGTAPATPVAEGAAAATPTPASTSAPAAVSTAAPQASSPSSTPIAFPTATPGKPSTWTLQRGEHPYCIARRFDINPVDLLNASGLSAGGDYAVGTKLTIPKDARDFPGKRSLKSHPDYYTVGSRDTIYSIACEYGDADPNAIALANGLSAPYKLSNGQELYIP